MRPLASIARLLAVSALALGVLAGAPRPARAAIVERVVAVIGERPILLSELGHRARPHLIAIAAQAPSPAQQAAAESEKIRELLTRMIDDRLEEIAADKARLSISAEEVDAGIKNVAASQRLSVPDLLAEAARQGLSEQDYRDEIRRQLLEVKLIQLRVRGRVRVTETDARAAYARWLRDFGGDVVIEPRILALRIQLGATAQDIQVRETFAQDLAMRARKGEDFCKLVAQYSDDTQTKTTCGSRGPQPMQALFPPLQELVKKLGAGETGDPLRFGNEAILIVQVRDAAHVPKFEEVKEAMLERAFGEAMERQRKAWLQELRRGLYIDVRL
jgi:peptidyl-prolyl cis-trans isomerase SurA